MPRGICTVPVPAFRIPSHHYRADQVPFNFCVIRPVDSGQDRPRQVLYHSPRGPPRQSARLRPISAIVPSPLRQYAWFTKNKKRHRNGEGTFLPPPRVKPAGVPPLRLPRPACAGLGGSPNPLMGYETPCQLCVSARPGPHVAGSGISASAGDLPIRRPAAFGRTLDLLTLHPTAAPTGACPSAHRSIPNSRNTASVCSPRAGAGPGTPPPSEGR